MGDPERAKQIDQLFSLSHADNTQRPTGEPQGRLDDALRVPDERRTMGRDSNKRLDPVRSTPWLAQVSPGKLVDRLDKVRSQPPFAIMHGSLIKSNPNEC